MKKGRAQTMTHDFYEDTFVKLLIGAQHQSLELHVGSPDHPGSGDSTS